MSEPLAPPEQEDVPVSTMKSMVCRMIAGGRRAAITTLASKRVKLEHTQAHEDAQPRRVARAPRSAAAREQQTAQREVLRAQVAGRAHGHEDRDADARARARRGHQLRDARPASRRQTY